MKIVYNAAELDLELQRLLDHHGRTLVSSRHLAMESKRYRDDSQIYDLDAGTTTDAEFFHYLVDIETAMFLFAGEPFLIYVFTCNPHELITYVESEFTESDVELAKDYIATMLGKRVDLAVSATVADLWMAAE